MNTGDERPRSAGSGLVGDGGRSMREGVRVGRPGWAPARWRPAVGYGRLLRRARRASVKASDQPAA
ncbi:hypothetical protein JCM4814A_20760 [Streptomyces phaeofaciens JCM 4814]|uniref:Uncharacterized protein n=1 Tax=Streptomyces phaeofaciens TaxID=68254 RepID=A0A918HF05_9ACTN|nr:hypothetical protein GCM10010226_36610 [Streptomyces phaeofaciens]